MCARSGIGQFLRVRLQRDHGFPRGAAGHGFGGHPMLAGRQADADFRAGLEYALGFAIHAEAAFQIGAQHQKCGLAAGCP